MFCEEVRGDAGYAFLHGVLDAILDEESGEADVNAAVVVDSTPAIDIATTAAPAPAAVAAAAGFPASL